MEDDQFLCPPPEKLVVYELLIRDFTDKHSFQAVIDSLNYLLKLGINAVELMPSMSLKATAAGAITLTIICSR
jgi:1,4-alpha-glucan branching enzyme